MVSIAVVVAVTVAFILGWLATHLGPQIKQTFCYRETIPNVLVTVFNFMINSCPDI